MADAEPEIQPEIGPTPAPPETQPAASAAEPEAESFWESSFGVVVTEASLLDIGRQLCKVRDGFTSWVRPCRATAAAPQAITPETVKLVGIEESRGDPLRFIGVGAEGDDARVVLLLSRMKPYASLWQVGLDERERVYAESIAKKHLRTRRPAFYWWLPPICTRVTRSWIGIFALSIVGTAGLIYLHLRQGWNKSLETLPGWLNTASYVLLPALIFRGTLDFIEFLFPPLQFVTGDEGKWLHAIRITIRIALVVLIINNFVLK